MKKRISELSETMNLRDGCCMPVVQDGETKKVHFEILSQLLIPVGTILPYVGGSAPTNFLICNGSTFNKDTYYKLYNILGTNVLPDLRGRFLQGANNNLRQNVEAGLPNVTGQFITQGNNTRTLATGPFTTVRKGTVDAGTSQASDYANVIGMDLSLSNPIYGNSNTVQPPAYTVNYIIRAN